MDVEDPRHLERFREQPEIKAVLLRFRPDRPASEARFERAAKNALYWPVVDGLADRFVTAGRAMPVQEAHAFYGRPCWLVATTLAPADDAPFTIAVVAADGAPIETLITALQDVSRDYWFGSYFFK